MSYGQVSKNLAYGRKQTYEFRKDLKKEKSNFCYFRQNCFDPKLSSPTNSQFTGFGGLRLTDNIKPTDIATYRLNQPRGRYSKNH